MILLSILVGLIAAIAAIAIITVIIAGGGILALFGDLIVFGLIMYAIIKIFKKKKK